MYTVIITPSHQNKLIFRKRTMPSLDQLYIIINIADQQLYPPLNQNYQIVNLFSLPAIAYVIY